MGETEKSAGGSSELHRWVASSSNVMFAASWAPLSSLAASARDLIWLTTRLQYAISLDLFGGPEYRVKMARATFADV